jgi:hypothetical protein
MPSFMQKLTELANSPEVKKLTDKAQQFANDPKTKEQVEKAKLKLAELRDSVNKPDGGSAKPDAGATATPPPSDDAGATGDPKAA